MNQSCCRREQKLPDSDDLVCFRRSSSRTGFFVKHVADRVVAAMILVFTFPFFVAITILIKSGSPGPVFFRQWRAGLRGQPFRIWKFRTMIVDADSAGPVTSISDSRVTRIGRILRLTSLDELPQLFNVLAGEMSLVGPRALLVESIRTEEMRRLAVKPGVTSLPIVRGRQCLDWETRMSLDNWYIDHWTLMLDLHIIAQTIVVVALRKNVYDNDGEMKERSL